MELKNILIETRDSIAIITINRPKVLNALNFETVKELEQAVRKTGDRKDVRVIVITGAGDKAFVSGADIAAMREMGKSQAAEFADEGHRCMFAVENCPQPTIAAVNGYALGGGTELAISCDIIVASENAKFGLPEVKLGLYPGFGGTQRLPRLIGASRAREMIFTGRIITAREALEWDLVNHVYPQVELMENVMKMAAEIAANSPVAVSAAKRVVREGLDMHRTGGLKNEQEQFSALFTTEDRIEGMTAFLEKRKPCFKGR